MASPVNIRQTFCSNQTPGIQRREHQIGQPQERKYGHGSVVEIDPIQIEVWKRRIRESASTVSEQQIAEAAIRVVDAVQVVSFDTFREKLNRSFGAILPRLFSREQEDAFQQLQAIRKDPRTDVVQQRDAQSKIQAIAQEAFRDKAVVLVEGGKSNKWVAELALFKNRKLEFIPYQFNRLGQKDANDFTRWVEEDGNLAKLQGKSIILFDDGSYSGTQLHDHVQAIQKCAKGILNICVVVPYMTELARQRVTSLHNKPCPVYVGSLETIQTLRSIGADGLLAAHTWGENPDLGLSAFDFKLPNSQSFPDFVAKGRLVPGKQVKGDYICRFIREGIPPYKVLDNGHLDSTSSRECPPEVPDYKQDY